MIQKAGSVSFLLFFLFLLSKFLIMGRGDKRTKRGKIAMGSFGKKRPAKVAITGAKAAEKKA